MERPTRLRVLRGESPLSLIGRFERLAYPMHVKVTTRVLLGWRSRSRTIALRYQCGGSQDGEQIWRPEEYTNGNGPEIKTHTKLLQVDFLWSPTQWMQVGKADVAWEGTVMCTT